MNPTEEQQREFWEWCGFKKLYPWDNLYTLPNSDNTSIWVDMRDMELDLNNLFKWAVPKFISKEAKNDLATYPIRAWNKLFRLWYEEMKTTKDPALALFRAIYTI